MLRRFSLVIPAVAVAAVLVWHWLPARQVQLHQRNFEAAVENRDWKRFELFLAPDYADRWGNNRTVLLARLPPAFQDFLALGIQDENATLARDGLSLVWSARPKLTGSGGPIAQAIMNHVAELHEPFSFTWKRQSWKPWDWKLVCIAQPELEFPPDIETP
jgi:hypothetical protein